MTTTMEAPASVQVGNRLAELCRQGKFDAAVAELYSPDVVQVEPFDMTPPPGMPKMPRKTHGIQAVKEKGKWWTENHVVHSAQVKGPLVSTEKFTVLFEMDVTFKPAGKRFTMREAGVYTVEGGKITHVEFLFEGPCGGGQG